MKKAEKRQAEEFLDLLEQAHSEIRKSLDKKDVSTALTLLADCQDGAISLGNLIEATEGEGFVTIPLLEEYCELAYQLHESLAGEESVEAGKAYKLLRNQVIKIRNSVRNDIKVRKEVVFLPYKAAMWDSLESVWKAACEDPDCDAYVIPIPYYDKNPDGSFREMHYEGNLYPKDVPVTWYKDYDFAENRPDVIFIHNPYDECNYVTSVHPDFYSGKLKEYTDKLVYIPYFILAEPDLENDTLEGMAHFCTVPGVINADQIIVQSEDMRKAYIRILTRAYGENTRGIWSKKILGIGSPKVDKVLNTKKEDLEIPAEWLKIIQKPDGSWKKIVLYNTSVSALLEHGEKMLEKIQDVFRVFKENQDDVSLLWRPHPLIQATVESMRPWLWEEYRKLREQYQAEGWGIYDDSADMDRAIAISDGYYGDPSSVVQLCREVGKPTEIQNVKLKEKQQTIYFHDMIKVDNEIWFSAINRNGLYRMNDKASRMELMHYFPDEGFFATFLHSKVFSCGKKIISVPFQARQIHVFDRETKKMLAMDFSEISDSIGYSFFDIALQDKNVIYMIPCRYKKMIRYDVSLGELKEIDVIKDDYKHKWNKEGPFVLKGACIVESKIYLSSFSADFIEVYDLHTNDIKYIDVPLKSNGISGISHLLYEDGIFWVIGKNGTICKWEKNSGEMELIEIKRENADCYAFFNALLYKGKLYLSDSIENMVYVYDLQTGQKQVLRIGDLPGQKHFDLFWGSYTSMCILQNDLLGIVSAWDGGFYEINILGDSYEIRKREFELDEPDALEIEKQLKDLKLIGTQEKEIPDEIGSARSSVGKSIFASICCERN